MCKSNNETFPSAFPLFGQLPPKEAHLLRDCIAGKKSVIDCRRELLELQQQPPKSKSIK